MRSVLAVALCALAGTQAFVAPIARPRYAHERLVDGGTQTRFHIIFFVCPIWLSYIWGPMVCTSHYTQWAGANYPHARRYLIVEPGALGFVLQG